VPAAIAAPQRAAGLTILSAKQQQEQQQQEQQELFWGVQGASTAAQVDLDA
jgi:hypothetical protein